ncbi:hypothetical protein C1645_802005 [Glomus cerebriforme]|uniref:C2H2-type domain-containing protein n=1 Tax=Glomus cerebriforme TaxID=658196 RepID=A0A397TKW5_9GLOM|nr:hypothetical protein C1645_802005 [Glomus cerebriforme]
MNSFEHIMSKPVAPFVCKRTDSHLKQQRFNTQEELEFHFDNDHKDVNISKLEIFRRGCRFFQCPWQECQRQESDIIKLKEHLRKHAKQKPFKCPICKFPRRFGSIDKLNGHLVTDHNDSIVDPTDSDYMSDDNTLRNENEKQRIGKINYEVDVLDKENAKKDVADVLVKGIVNKDEVATAKLSYRDVLVKERVNVNKQRVNVEEKVDKNEDIEDRRYEHKKNVWDLFRKGMEAISLLPEDPVVYDISDINLDNLPYVPQKVLSETEQDKLFWDAFCRMYEGSEAVKLLNEAFELADTEF